MAKVATGQKLDRLPPGKIFGMSVTEPKSTADQDDSAASVSRELDGGSEDLKEDPPRAPINGMSSTRLQNCSDGAEICSRSRSHLFDAHSNNKLEGPKEAAVSQTSVETLARLFPNTKLSVLQLVLQRCGQDLLKAIEYFASDNLGVEPLSTGSRTSAFRPARPSQTIVDSSGGSGGEQQQSQPIAGAMLAPIYTSLSRNVYGDAGYCLLNIVPEQLTSVVATDATGNALPIAKTATDQDTLALTNFRYSSYLSPGVQQQLRDHVCAQVADRLSARSSVLHHLPPVLPGIPCVQPNCAQCNYKFA